MPTQKELHFATVAVDVALFTIHDDKLFVRLISVDRPPHYAKTRALPGGLIAPAETADEAVMRHLESKAHISPKNVHLEQLHTMSAIHRDRRGRVISVTYLALVSWEALSDEERRDELDTYWEPMGSAKKLAFDHDDILKIAKVRLAERVHATTVVSRVLPKHFTLTELETALSLLSDKAIDKRNFRKKALATETLVDTYETRGGKHRPAALYRFAKKQILDISLF